MISLCFVLFCYSFSLDPEQQALIDQMPRNIIAAHRGTTVYAPENTEVAFRWARNMGAEFMETDLHQTKDGVIILLHDDTFRRTSNVGSVFPGREGNTAYDFLFDEVLQLDFGSWFGARFSGEQICTLEDLIMVAEGYRLLRRRDLPNVFPNSTTVQEKITVRTNEINIPEDLEKAGIVDFKIGVEFIAKAIYIPDDADNGHRPGIFPEIKVTSSGLHVNEGDVAKLLTNLGWYNDDPNKMKKIPNPPITDNKTRVDIANTDVRMMMLSFNIDALIRFQSALLRLRPLVFLVNGGASEEVFRGWIELSNDVGVTVISPSIGGSVYSDGFNISKGKLVHEAGFFIQPWTFGSNVDQYMSYSGGDNPLSGPDDNYLDGVTTDRTDTALDFYRSLGDVHFRSNAHLNLPDNLHANKPVVDPHQLITDLGY